MGFLGLGSARPLALLCVVSMACACAAAMPQQQTQPSQTAPGAEQRRAGGSKSITGCLLKGDTGFVVKSPEGTYELNTDRDLTPYVGKMVRIESKWDATGTLTNSPMESSPAAAGSNAPGSPATDTGTAAFVGDLHVHITGTVLGDCETQK